MVAVEPGKKTEISKIHDILENFRSDDFEDILQHKGMMFLITYYLIQNKLTRVLSNQKQR